MRELHLFSGIGGGILGGLLLGHRCVGAVEVNPYCREVLAARQRDGVLESFPILDDVRTFDGTAWRGKVDVVCGGFPCQPWSTAGKRLGTADPRHLWPEMARIVSEVRPAYVFAENVSLAAFEQPWRDLRRMGYRVPPALCLGASHVGAPHRRLRWWMLAADADGNGVHQLNTAQHQPRAGRGPAAAGSDGRQGDVANADSEAGGCEEGNAVGGAGCQKVHAGAAEPGRRSRNVADAEGGRLEGSENGDRQHRISSRQRDGEPVRECGGVDAVADAGGAGLATPEQGGQGRRGPSRGDDEREAASERCWWTAEPRVGRVAHGVPSRVERLKALGNAQVPAVAAEAFAWLMREHYGAEVRA